MNVIIDEDVDEHKAIYYWMIHKLICSSSLVLRFGSKTDEWRTNANASQSHGPTLQFTPIPQWPRRFFKHAQIQSEWLRTELMGMLNLCHKCQSWLLRCSRITFPTRHIGTHPTRFHLRNRERRALLHRHRNILCWTEASRAPIKSTTDRWLSPRINARHHTTSSRVRRHSTQHCRSRPDPIRASTTAAVNTISARRATTTAPLSLCHQHLRVFSWRPRNHPPRKPSYLWRQKSPNYLNPTNRRRNKTIKIPK